MSGLRSRLENGDVVYGCFSLLVEPVFLELAGLTGFDFVVVDCEEAAGDNYGANLEQLLRAADSMRIPSMVRTVGTSRGAINRALNAGAAGILVPHVRTADEAREVVAAGRYPPVGRRGAAPVVRAASYGLEPWPEYCRRANEDTLIFAMIEDTEGIENIEDIVSVPGIDGIMVGTWDLAVELNLASYGPPAQEIVDHVEHVVSVTRAAGLFMAAQGWSGEAAAKYIDQGCQLIFVSLDSNMLLQGLSDLKKLADRIEAAG